MGSALPHNLEVYCGTFYTSWLVEGSLTLPTPVFGLMVSFFHFVCLPRRLSSVGLLPLSSIWLHTPHLCFGDLILWRWHNCNFSFESLAELVFQSCNSSCNQRSSDIQLHLSDFQEEFSSFKNTYNYTLNLWGIEMIVMLVLTAFSWFVGRYSSGCLMLSSLVGHHVGACLWFAVLLLSLASWNVRLVGPSNPFSSFCSIVVISCSALSSLWVWPTSLVLSSCLGWS